MNLPTRPTKLPSRPKGLPPRPKPAPLFSRPEDRIKPQIDFFESLGVTEDWRAEWQGMPEFINEEQKPHMTIPVHFESIDNAKRFGELIGQTVTPNTRYLWWPEQKLKKAAAFGYESETYED